jgi:hypothetical protein
MCQILSSMTLRSYSSSVLLRVSGNSNSKMPRFFWLNHLPLPTYPLFKIRTPLVLVKILAWRSIWSTNLTRRRSFHFSNHCFRLLVFFWFPQVPSSFKLLSPVSLPPLSLPHSFLPSLDSKNLLKRVTQLDHISPVSLPLKPPRSSLLLYPLPNTSKIWSLEFWLGVPQYWVLLFQNATKENFPTVVKNLFQQCCDN